MNPAPAQSLEVDVGRLLDEGRWSTYQRWLVFVTAVTIVFDGIDNQLMGVTLPAILRQWALPKSAFAPVISLGFLGMVIGGALGGLVGDRVGRRTALMATALGFGAMTLAASAATSVAGFGVLRFLAGLGLGGAIPNAAALAAEFAPVRNRPFAVTITVVCTPVGATLAGLFAIPALPILGWRALFAAGGLMSIAVALIVRWLLPESPRFLIRHPRRRDELLSSLRKMGHPVPEDATLVDRVDAPVERPSVLTLFAPQFRIDTISLWAAFLTGMTSVYLSLSWLPTLLTEAGFSSSIASAGITVFNLGGLLGALGGAACVRRWGSSRSMPAMALLAAMSAAAMSQMRIAGGSPETILVMLAVTGALINSVQSTMFALAAHVYPAAVRGTGVGVGAAFGRIGAIASGYIGVWALEYRGSTSFFGLIALALIVCALSLMSVRRHVVATR